MIKNKIIDKCYDEYFNSLRGTSRKYDEASDELPKVWDEIKSLLPKDKVKLMDELEKICVTMEAEEIESAYENGFNTGASLIMKINETDKILEMEEQLKLKLEKTI